MMSHFVSLSNVNITKVYQLIFKKNAVPFFIRLCISQVKISSIRKFVP